MTIATRMKTIRVVHDILRENLAERPDKTALVCDGQRLTYAQIDERANRLANALHQSGVQRGDRIILYMLNSVEAVVSVFGALKANAVFSVVDYATQPDRLEYIIGDCEAVALITHDHQSQLATQLVDDVPSLQFAILTGAKGVQKAQQVSGLSAFDTIQQDFSPDPPPQRTIDRDLAYLVYTSGSTGEPKGVITTHHGSLFAIHIAIDYLGLDTGDVITSALPLSYSHGFNQLLKTLRVGGTLILEKSFAYPAVTLRRMETERATGFAGVPTVLALLMQLDLSRYDLGHLRFLSSAGAPLAPTLIRKIRRAFPQASLFSIYGMAEASNALGLDPMQIDNRPTSVGKAMPGTEVWMIDEDGQRLGPNDSGELVVRGGHVRPGYWNDPQTSARRLRPGPLPGELVCHTGDVFRMDEEGFLYFVGRGDEIIKTGGKKVSPKEIENALYSLDGVLEAAAIGIDDPVLGQVIKAYVALDRQAKTMLTEERIIEHCRQTLEEFKVPRQIEIRDRLPKTASGKIVKTDLA